ncbi:MAG: beta-galactosidase [bacterium]|nr:beta-galactosidase [bacterium]
MKTTKSPMLPDFPYGAVYFRKTNPPQEDWARDYATAQEDGMNIFRHWFLWSAIEVAPGKYDWNDYDRQLDLAAKHGIKTIIAEMIVVAPEWTYRKFPHALSETRDGKKHQGYMHGSCATGGVSICFDNEDTKQAAEQFLRTLAERYKDHLGLGGYDIWNECNYSADHCFCPDTVAKFRTWLKKKYNNDLDALAKAWYRYSLAEWEDIRAPRHMGGYPDVLDWLEFRIDNAYEMMRWRCDIIRSADPGHSITAHGVAAGLTGMAARGADDWRAAFEVEGYGYTWGSSRHGDEPWKQFHAVDLVRASSRGKYFWHAESYGGPLWMQPQVIGKPRDEGRIATVEDVSFWNLVSFMGGATGALYLRWRPLLDGVLFGAFGPYGMDGSRTERSDRASKVAKWAQAPEQEALWQSRPVKGEVGIVYVPETQIFNYAQQGNPDFYAKSMQGAYQGFFENNIQADWVRIEHIDEYDLLYLPFPVMLNKATVEKLKQWVEAGGTLVCEGCPAYFGERGHVGQQQPNYGLDSLFGAKESYVEFTPDLLGDLQINVNGNQTWGGIYLQAYEPTTGIATGWYEDARVAAVDYTYGKGKTRLIGTMTGAGQSAHPDEISVAFFRDVLSFGGKEQMAHSTDSRIKARIHAGKGGTYLWVANPKRQDIPVRLTLSSELGSFTNAKTLWGSSASVEDGIIVLTAGARDVTVLALD